MGASSERGGSGPLQSRSTGPVTPYPAAYLSRESLLEAVFAQDPGTARVGAWVLQQRPRYSTGFPDGWLIPNEPDL